MNKMQDNSSEDCLICSSKIPTTPDLDNFTQLSKNLTVIFLLKNLLQLPDIQLEKNLKEFGDPVNWIRLCEQCDQLTRKALGIHGQIVKLDSELCSIQQEIVDKTKLSFSSSTAPHNSNKRSELSHRTRQIVKNSITSTVCTPTNPFIEGDKLAKQLETSQIHESNFNFQNLSNDKDEHITKSIYVIKVKYEVECEPSPANDDDIPFEDPVDGSDPSEKIDIKYENQHNSQSSTPNSHLRKRVKINGKTKCLFCEKMFSSKRACLTHEQETHCVTKGAFPCDICQKPFNCSYYRNIHRRKVHQISLDGKKVKGVNCPYCSKYFKAKVYLDEHVKNVHEKRFPCTCHICGFGCKDKTKLKRHLKTHNHHSS